MEDDIVVTLEQVAEIVVIEEPEAVETYAIEDGDVEVVTTVEVEASDIIQVVEETVEVIELGMGAPGAPGKDGVVQMFSHVQTAPATEWIVNHNLGKKPFTEIRNIGGERIGVKVVHVSENQFRIYATAAIAGEVRYL